MLIVHGGEDLVCNPASVTELYKHTVIRIRRLRFTQVCEGNGGRQSLRVL